MISINLVPQVKAEFLKAQRMKRFIMLASFLVTALMIAAVTFLAIFVYVAQARQSSGLKNDIDEQLTALKQVDSLERIVTVKNQLDSLPQLHEAKPVSSRLFDYLTVIVPENVSFSRVAMTFNNENSEFAAADDEFTEGIESSFNSGGSFEFFGAADSFKDFNVLVDSLKNAGYTVNNEQVTPTRAFNAVTTEDLDKDDGGVFFSVKGDFAADLFSFNFEDVRLEVPSLTSSPSVRGDLFTNEAVPIELEEGGSQ